jgi:septal ring factor EnvC (AmiA/AmiB activator)
MAMVNKFFLIGCFLISSSFVEAKKLADFSREVLHLGAKIQSLEKEVGIKNALYLSKLEEAKEIENQLYDLEEGLKTTEEKLQQKKNRTTKLLRSLALSLAEDEITPKREYFHILQLQKHQIDQELQAIEVLKQDLQKTKTELDNTRSLAQEMVVALHELESQKKQVADVYVQKLESKNQLEMKAQKQKLQLKWSSLRKATPHNHEKVTLRVGLPLRDFSQMVPSPKGITLKFENSQPLFAPYAGKVIYHGELASYGKVLMIDHGGDLRSVILGPFESTLSKGDTVKTQQEVGYIKSTQSTSLYFELRQRNIAQRTINWIDENSFSKI